MKFYIEENTSISTLRGIKVGGDSIAVSDIGPFGEERIKQLLASGHIVKSKPEKKSKESKPEKKSKESKKNTELDKLDTDAASSDK